MTDEDVKWYCQRCEITLGQNPHQHQDVACDECGECVDYTGIIPDAAKCGTPDCIHMSHQSCLSDQRQEEYHNLTFYGVPFFKCAASENEE